MSDERDEKGMEVVARSSARRFGDEEIGDILRRAADLQERSVELTSGAGRGLTLEELRQVALEAGIDPRFIDLAAADSNSPADRTTNAFYGGPYRWRYHTSLDGEIDDRDREDILFAVRSMIGTGGELADVFGRMEWTHNPDGLGPFVMGVTSRDGKTEIDIMSDRGAEPGLYFGLGVPFGGIFGGAVLSKLLGISGALALPLVAGASVVAYGAARLLWSFRSESWERKVEQVVERVASIVQNRTPRPAITDGSGENRGAPGG